MVCDLPEISLQIQFCVRLYPEHGVVLVAIEMGILDRDLCFAVFDRGTTVLRKVIHRANLEPLRFVELLLLVLFQCPAVQHADLF